MIVNIPNSLTLARIIAVPFVVWLIISNEMTLAFILFLLAGASDAADGFLAKRFGWNTELGAYLDPIADKALLVSIYVTLGFSGHLPVWLVIAVVSRDVLIVGAFMLSSMLGRPVAVQPILISKFNTFFQIVLAGVVLAELGVGFGLGGVVQVLAWITGILTITSAGAYFWGWLVYMARYEPVPHRPARRAKGVRGAQGSGVSAR
ncbi:CDP-alcohol phosphatidyltransferase family protein [Methyloligella solikamskensis]|uniref:CDP-diacylglycerol--glycerol-3-phosphate 3-phosphatidyltransferase n=1 Tax=Methyloligella solikamskensis TaxID=1177756 RepID=A0ABW3JAM3_9HYPH